MSASDECDDIHLRDFFSLSEEPLLAGNSGGQAPAWGKAQMELG